MLLPDLLSWVGCAEGRRIAGAGLTRRCVLRISCSLRRLYSQSRRELTPVLCFVRLSWRRRARPSTTLHEIQICCEADWNTYL